MDHEIFDKVTEVIGLFLNGKSYGDADIPTADRYVVCRLLALRSKYYLDPQWVPFWEQAAEGYFEECRREAEKVQS